MPRFRSVADFTANQAGTPQTDQKGQILPPSCGIGEPLVQARRSKTEPPMSSSQTIREPLPCDDVLRVPGLSKILPANADTRTRLTKTVELGIPLISAAMDTVTEAGL